MTELFQPFLKNFSTQNFISRNCFLMKFFFTNSVAVPVIHNSLWNASFSKAQGGCGRDKLRVQLQLLKLGTSVYYWVYCSPTAASGCGDQNVLFFWSGLQHLVHFASAFLQLQQFNVQLTGALATWPDLSSRQQMEKMPKLVLWLFFFSLCDEKHHRLLSVCFCLKSTV